MLARSASAPECWAAESPRKTMLDVITLANTLPSRVKQATSVAELPTVSRTAAVVTARGTGPALLPALLREGGPPGAPIAFRRQVHGQLRGRPGPTSGRAGVRHRAGRRRRASPWGRGPARACTRRRDHRDRRPEVAIRALSVHASTVSPTPPARRAIKEGAAGEPSGAGGKPGNAARTHGAGPARMGSPGPALLPPAQL
jgi:hypothetical protein